MASFGTEFHAMPDEIGQLIADWMERHPVYVNAFAFPPERRISFNRDTLHEVIAQSGYLTLTFTFTVEQVDPAINSDYDVASRGYKPLHLQVGRVTKQGLEQSWLATKTATDLWKKMNAELKKLTTAGATLICENGTQTIDRNARFTAGAKTLAASGVPLRQTAQATHFHYLPK